MGLGDTVTVCSILFASLIVKSWWPPEIMKWISFIKSSVKKGDSCTSLLSC